MNVNQDPKTITNDIQGRPLSPSVAKTMTEMRKNLEEAGDQTA